MAANMLGADLESLTALSERLNVMSTVLIEGSDDAARIATDVASDLDAAITSATARVDSGLAVLKSEISSAYSQTQSTAWNGGNQAAFLGKHEEFNTSLEGTLVQVEEAYGSFKAGLDALTVQIGELQTSFTTNLTNAEQATQAMSSAVLSQRDALDSVMNSAV